MLPPGDRQKGSREFRQSFRQTLLASRQTCRSTVIIQSTRTCDGRNMQPIPPPDSFRLHARLLVALHAASPCSGARVRPDRSSGEYLVVRLPLCDRPDPRVLPDLRELGLKSFKTRRTGVIRVGEHGIRERWQDEPPLRLVKSYSAGTSRARDAGVESARATWILFTHDDTLPAPDCSLLWSSLGLYRLRRAESPNRRAEARPPLVAGGDLGLSAVCLAVVRSLIADLTG
jgi:hypothetical protein